MIYVVMTKWVESQVPNFGTVKEPACNIAGVVSCQHLSGATAVDGDAILCVVECDQATADKIEATGVGRLLWQTKDRSAILGVNAAAIVTKLTGYGVDPAISSKVDPLKTGLQCEQDLATAITGKPSAGGGGKVDGGGAIGGK